MFFGSQKPLLYSSRASAVRAPGVPFCTSKCSSRKKFGSAPIICSGRGAFWIRKNHHIYLVANSLDVSRYIRRVAQSPKRRLCGLPSGDLSKAGVPFGLLGRENQHKIAD